jgi:hypothetical protein
MIRASSLVRRGLALGAAVLSLAAAGCASGRGCGPCASNQDLVAYREFVQGRLPCPTTGRDLSDIGAFIRGVDGCCPMPRPPAPCPPSPCGPRPCLP